MLGLESCTAQCNGLRPTGTSKPSYTVKIIWYHTPRATCLPVSVIKMVHGEKNLSLLSTAYTWPTMGLTVDRLLCANGGETRDGRVVGVFVRTAYL